MQIVVVDHRIQPMSEVMMTLLSLFHAPTCITSLVFTRGLLAPLFYQFCLQAGGSTHLGVLINPQLVFQVAVLILQKGVLLLYLLHLRFEHPQLVTAIAVNQQYVLHLACKHLLIHPFELHLQFLILCLKLLQLLIEFEDLHLFVMKFVLEGLLLKEQ